MQKPEQKLVELIPIDRIAVINPRERNQRVFKEIVASIEQVGLKKPITVSKHNDEDGPRYDLVCGQGRLEAFQVLGQSAIPALVIDADAEDCAVMSLVENCARRQHRAIDLLHDIQGMKHRGYGERDIARKTGLSVDYVRDVGGLLENGELRLLRGVESGHIPISVAVQIAQATDSDVQEILQQAYEKKQLRGRKLLAAKRLIEQRRNRGKGLRSTSGSRDRPLSSASLLRAYREDVDRKQVLIRKSNATRDRLIFITEAMRKLLSDEGFTTLLRAEGLDTLPKNLADRIQAWARA